MAETAEWGTLRHPALAPGTKHLFNSKEVNDTALLLPQVVMKDHMCSLAAEAPDVVGVVVTSVAVDVMDDLFGQLTEPALFLLVEETTHGSS